MVVGILATNCERVGAALIRMNGRGKTAASGREPRIPAASIWSRWQQPSPAGQTAPDYNWMAMTASPSWCCLCLPFRRLWVRWLGLRLRQTAYYLPVRRCVRCRAEVALRGVAHRAPDRSLPTSAMLKNVLYSTFREGVAAAWQHHRLVWPVRRVCLIGDATRRCLLGGIICRPPFT